MRLLYPGFFRLSGPFGLGNVSGKLCLLFVGRLLRGPFSHFR
jgi:hypothetical protein